MPTFPSAVVNRRLADPRLGRRTMTTLLPLRAIAACIALAAISLSAGDTFVRIDKEGGSRLNETLWKAEWGSYQKAKEEVRSFSARIRNNTKSTRTYVLEWYFIADNPLSKERSVASWGTLVKELAPGVYAYIQAKGTWFVSK